MVTKAQREREKKAAELRRNKRGMLFTILSLPAGFGSWGYFVITANPNFYFGIGLFAVAALFLAIAVFEFLGNVKARIALLLAIFGGFYFVYEWSLSNWKQKIISDIVNGLEIQMALSSSGDDPQDSVITLVNNSHTDLLDHRVLCNIKKWTVGKMDIAEDVGSGVNPASGPIKSGGDAETRSCLRYEEGGGNLHVTNIPYVAICMDIQVQINFKSAGSMPVEGNKSNRFVYGFLGNRSWVRESEDRKSSYCPKPQ